MLVLSRRPGQKVVFPGLGIQIEVLRSRGAVTRLGIEAPDDVVVLREEIVGRLPRAEAVHAPPLSAAEREQRHTLNNQLNLMMLKLELLKRQLEMGKAVDAEKHLDDVLAELSTLEHATADAPVVKSTAPRILIVEDEANERELLASCLRLRGLDVVTTGSGREAFDYLHEHELPDLILLDMRMPDVDGPTFLKSVRDSVRLHDVRVFAVSGSSRSDFSSDPMQIDGWISKPVRIDALLQAVRDKPVATTA